MELYQKMYLTLFAATEDVLNMLDAAPLSFCLLYTSDAADE